MDKDNEKFTADEGNIDYAKKVKLDFFTKIKLQQKLDLAKKKLKEQGQNEEELRFAIKKMQKIFEIKNDNDEPMTEEDLNKMGIEDLTELFNVMLTELERIV